MKQRLEPQSLQQGEQRLSANALSENGSDHGLNDDDNGLSLSPLVPELHHQKQSEVRATQEMRAAGRRWYHYVLVSQTSPLQHYWRPRVSRSRQLTKYTGGGTALLRKAIAGHLASARYKYDAATEILLGNGAKQVVYQAVLATCRPGDEVILPAPYWPSYPEIIKLAGARPVIVETRREDGYILQPEDLRAALSGATRLLILCNPSNPTGAVHDRAALEALANVLADHANQVPPLVGARG